jgi:hypothetical protein
MPRKDRRHGVNPGEILIELRGRSGGDKGRLIADLCQESQARLVRRPRDRRDEREQQKARGSQQLTTNGLSIEKLHGFCRLILAKLRLKPKSAGEVPVVSVVTPCLGRARHRHRGLSVQRCA